MEEKTFFEKFRDIVDGVPDLNGDLDKMEPFFDKIRYQDFTPLQQEVMSSADFWDNGTNMIIQGSTYSGKTLAAEIAMAYQIYCRGKNVLYFVPLKALTSEKERTYYADYRDEEGEPLRIYSSSSDYQEHDYDLMRGDYDIGILVYEKFFALLAQEPKKFLGNCDLVVVDEMHMLQDGEREPKLEFSIEKLKYIKNQSKNYNVDFSFLGLTAI